MNAEATVLALEPIVNGTRSKNVFGVEQDSDGGYSLRAEELRSLRVKLDPQIGPDQRISLSTLGVAANYVESSQSLELSVPDALLVPTELDARGGRTAIDVNRIASTPGLLLNYRVFGSIQEGDDRAVRLSGDLEAVGTIGNSLFVTNGFFRDGGSGKSFVRGDSFFRYEDPAKVRTYTIGDLQSGAVNFSRSVRLGGVQIQSAFRQRPDIYIGPLPQFSGSAALPSSLDLFADSVRVFSTNVPQGPFVLRSLPQITGNELRIVTTDANGRQTVITTPYFDAPGLIRKGLVEYSAELGAPRVDAGLRSFGYRSQLFASGTVRYGLDDRTTIEAHAEAGGDLANAGFGVIRALGALGSITASASGSVLNGRTGARVSAEYRFDVPRFSFFASAEREFGDYFDLGDIATSRRGPIGQSLASGQARSVERAGLSYRPPFDPTSINLTYTHFRLGSTEFRNANLGVRRPISNRLSFRGDGVFDLRRGGSVGVLLGLDIRLGRDARAFVGGDRTNGRTSYSVSANGFSGGRQNALGWSVAQRGSEDGPTMRSASLDYRFPEAFVAGNIEQSGNSVRGSAQIEGSFVAAGGGLFAANRIGESFAIVQNAGPGVAILQSGRKIATANARGRALLSSLEAFNETRVSLDAATLPPGLEAEKGTDFSVVTGRRRAAIVDFGVRKVLAAVLLLQKADGKAIPPGSRVTVNSGEFTLMGYDGEVYLRDLQPQNSVDVDLGSDGKCSARFDYDQAAEPQPRIGPVICE